MSVLHTLFPLQTLCGGAGARSRGIPEDWSYPLGTLKGGKGAMSRMDPLGVLSEEDQEQRLTVTDGTDETGSWEHLQSLGWWMDTASDTLIRTLSPPTGGEDRGEV
jgi:hypothetical protein